MKVLGFKMLCFLVITCSAFCYVKLGKIEQNKGFVEYSSINSVQDTFIFIFRADDYIKESNLQKITLDDSLLAMEYSTLLSKLEVAKDTVKTSIGDIYSKKSGARLFPNTSTLMDLFVQKKVIVFSLKNGLKSRVKYRVKRNEYEDYVVGRHMKNRIFNVTKKYN